MFNLIASITENGTIGSYNTNDLIYDIPEDKRYFKHITTGTNPLGIPNVVIMGRKTWESIPPKFKPLSDRQNIIISRTIKRNIEGVLIYNSINEFINFFIKSGMAYGELFVIGGGQLFSSIMKDYYGWIKRIYLTEIYGNIDVGNVIEPIYFPQFDKHLFTVERETKLMTSSNEFVIFKVYRNICYIGEDNAPAPPFESTNNDEMQYLKILKELMIEGDIRETRNSITRSKFGIKMEFSVKDGIIPIITTKKMAIKTVIKELLWFISGNTDNKELQKEGVHIWDGNSSREFLDSCGFHDREEGDLGPIYGFQWRYAGCQYVDCHTDYKNTNTNTNGCGCGIDQLKECIKSIIENPTSRRMIVCSWNVPDLKLMALPPCHVLFQWYVSSSGGLSLQLYQRSGDFFLGVPFNIMSYSLLIHMVAHITGTKPDKFIHIIGDAHLYENHIQAVEEQLKRIPNEFPKVIINRKVHDIDDFKLDDFDIDGYKCFDQIKADMIA